MANHEQPDVLEHISDLSRIERTLGAKVGYQVLEPFEIDRTDPFPVQKALRTIIHFLRLPTMIALVVNQKAGIAGHIEVGDNYIEVDESTAASTERLLATLAHEVTHKYWDMNDMTSRLGQKPTIFDGSTQYEKLTDTSAIFLGLGKLLLNGCETSGWATTPNGPVSYHKVGYLTLKEAALVYRIVCEMRGIPPFKYLSGLQPVAAEAVKNAGTGLADAANRAQAQMDECERAIQDAQNTTTALETTLIGESKQVLQDAGLGLAALRELSSQSFDTEHDPCLRFLYSLQRDKQIEGTTSSTQAAVLELRSLAARARFLQDACLLVTGYGRSSEGTKVARRTGLFFAPCGKGDRAVARCPFCANSFVARSPRFEAVGRIKCAASLIAAAIRVLVSK